jgi:hypothetical protein
VSKIYFCFLNFQEIIVIYNIDHSKTLKYPS